MSEMTFLPPSDSLLETIAANIEDVDRRELLETMETDDVLEALKASRAASFECYVASYKGEAVAVFGIATSDSGGTFGIPWVIFTTEMRKYPAVLMRTSRNVLDRWRRMFPVLSNFVGDFNPRAIKWLTALGFSIGEEVFDNGYRQFGMTNV